MSWLLIPQRPVDCKRMEIIISEMLVEIEQTVGFLASFLYGTIPRRYIASKILLLNFNYFFPLLDAVN